MTGPSQGQLNARNGNAFHDAVYNALRQPENTTKVAGKTTSGKTINVEPDLMGLRTGVTEIKDWKDVHFGRQLQAEYDVATRTGQTYNLIISPRTQTVSLPLQQAVQRRGGIIVEFDAGTGTFRSVRFSGNQVVR